MKGWAMVIAVFCVMMWSGCGNAVETAPSIQLPEAFSVTGRLYHQGQERMVEYAQSGVSSAHLRFESPAPMTGLETAVTPEGWHVKCNGTEQLFRAESLPQSAPLKILLEGFSQAISSETPLQKCDGGYTGAGRLSSGETFTVRTNEQGYITNFSLSSGNLQFQVLQQTNIR